MNTACGTRTFVAERLILWASQHLAVCVCYFFVGAVACLLIMMGTVGTILNVVHDLWVKIVPACTIFGHGCIMDFPEDFMHVFEVVGNLVDFVVNVSDMADHLFATRPGALLTHGYFCRSPFGEQSHP